MKVLSASGRLPIASKNGYASLALVLRSANKLSAAGSGVLIEVAIRNSIRRQKLAISFQKIVCAEPLGHFPSHVFEHPVARLAGEISDAVKDELDGRTVRVAILVAGDLFARRIGDPEFFFQFAAD